MTKNVQWVLKLAIKNGQLDAFKTLAKEMSESTMGEKGAMAYEWFLTEDNKTCHIYGRYTDNEAVMVHLGNFGVHFAEHFMACVDPSGFEVYGPANDTVRGALADFQPSYLKQFEGFAR